MNGKIKGTNGITYDITLGEGPAQEIKVVKHTVTAAEEAAAEPLTLAIGDDASKITLLSCYIISTTGQHNLPAGLGVESGIIVDAGENLDEGNIISAAYIVEED